MKRVLLYFAVVVAVLELLYSLFDLVFSTWQDDSGPSYYSLHSWAQALFLAPALTLALGIVLALRRWRGSALVVGSLSSALSLAQLEGLGRAANVTLSSVIVYLAVAGTLTLIAAGWDLRAARRRSAA